MNNKLGVVFRQSLRDFPCPVVLGKKSPSFGLHRYKQGLQFVPLDDEGFSLRGDKRRLLYQGRRRSHRFTILGDTSFEYDCILEKEPENNVVSLLIIGAEHFDFFRQPYFVKDSSLKGSYAVYKKKTMIGEGTGKLCHIHRPLIIDARGRRVWGTLAIVGNMLHIIIPEKWLSEAKYPVIVDPIIGTTTVGSYLEHEEYYDYDDEEWVEWDEPIDGEWGEYVPVHYEGYEYYPYEMAYEYFVNKYVLPCYLNGTATAYLYINNYTYNYIDGRSETRNYNNGIYPIMYSDVNDYPVARISTQEQAYNTAITTSNPGGWRSATFKPNIYLPEGTNVWFGCYGMHYTPVYFDYGSRNVNTYDSTYGRNPFQNNFPYYPYHSQFEGLNMKLSTYFTFSGNYIKKLTQGVTINHANKKTGNYKRISQQNVFITDIQHKKASYNRKMPQTVNGSDYIKRVINFYRYFWETINIQTRLPLIVSYIRKCIMTVFNSLNINNFNCIIRTIAEEITIKLSHKVLRFIKRDCKNVVDIQSVNKRSQGFIFTISESIKSSDNYYFPVLFVRSPVENMSVSDTFRHIGDFIRELKIIADNHAETTHKGEFYRFNKDTLQAAGVLLRSLSLFVRIVSIIFMRDYLIGRFLRAREELKLKSLLCREIILESKID